MALADKDSLGSGTAEGESSFFEGVVGATADTADDASVPRSEAETEAAQCRDVKMVTASTDAETSPAFEPLLGECVPKPTREPRPLAAFLTVSLFALADLLRSCQSVDDVALCRLVTDAPRERWRAFSLTFQASPR